MPKVIQPKQFGPPLGLYSHGMSAPAGELVVVAGQVGLVDDGKVVGPDVGTQTKQALENVRAIVEAAGCSMRDVIRLQTFLTRAEDIPPFMKARSEAFAAHFPDGVYPPNTLVVVSRLVRPELLVEIEAMAVKRSGGPSTAQASLPRRARPAKRGRKRR